MTLTNESLEGRFDSRRNSLNAIRLALAVLVIVSHAWPMVGHDYEPGAGGMSLGGWAVLGFFGISGYLITRSRDRTPRPATYFTARALRILPGFLACLLIVAFVMAPLSTLAEPGSTYSLSSAVTYTIRNLALYPTAIAQPGITDTLTSVPYPMVWNGSLWTLFWEGCCYIMVGTAFTVAGRRTVRRGALAMTGLLVLVTCVLAIIPITAPSVVTRVAPLALAFGAGATLYLYQGTVRVSWMRLVAAAALLIVCAAIPPVSSLGAVPLAYLLLSVGGAQSRAVIPGRLDISYGAYIYGWPVMQLLCLTPLVDAAIGFYIVASVAGTAVLATASLFLVERPALSLKASAPAPRLADAVTPAP